VNLEQLTSLLNANEDFKSSGKYFDGAIQLEIGADRIWMKVFMGQAILVTRQPPPFAYTFSIKGSVDDWRFALVGNKSRFREAFFTGRLKVDGNTIEYARIGKAVHGVSEVLRQMVNENLTLLPESGGDKESKGKAA
jgi:putative sterol carrier protein